ncbi:BaiN/RdsA family NAD(P)/FAD-dependent oxidoreductase [Pleomorphovibrio marinus]|uniref:NAD(P)/FAD-dependent oxidoreductase n=1 Tax=Pleomorphovibrio marinus TaxID=2164132 RepID=UPI000E0C7891|nr:NAD(P)/FAD-dependent oxidoreductase [Pleomorphovibrio marinus]
MEKIAVIGGGASGFFAAIHAAKGENQVDIFEKTGKTLTKVKVSGGGRCNVTHNCLNPKKLIAFYPRGSAFLKGVFSKFAVKETMSWFETHGVSLKVEEDNRVFPQSDSSGTIISCLQQVATELGVRIRTHAKVEKVLPLAEGFEVQCNGESCHYTKVIVCSGGSSKVGGYAWIRELGHTIVSPIPSLFTFNLPGSSLTHLSGISMPHSQVRLVGTKLSYEGPILITHWGVSGPAVLKLSAFGAHWLHECEYHTEAQIRWNGDMGEEKLRSELLLYKDRFPKRRIGSHPMFSIPSRLWIFLLNCAEIEENSIWMGLSKKQINKLVENLFRFSIFIHGKTTFKDEFVTAGGVKLEEVNPTTMESKLIPGLYFSGEVLNLDGITGGFNFQAAWSTGYLAGTSASQQ